MKAYANKHYKDHDKRWAAKRAEEAVQIANEPKYRETLYKDGEAFIFVSEKDYKEALKRGFTDGIDGNSPKTAKMLKPKRTKKGD